MYCCCWLLKKIDKLAYEDWLRRVEEIERRRVEEDARFIASLGPAVQGHILARREHFERIRLRARSMREPAPAEAPAPATAEAPAPAPAPAPAVAVEEATAVGNIQCALCLGYTERVFRSCVCSLNICELCKQSAHFRNLTQCPQCRNEDEFPKYHPLWCGVSNKPLEPLMCQLPEAEVEASTESSV